jgi:hypothetical protein
VRKFESSCYVVLLRQGHAFVWEKDTVQISHQQNSVLFTGRWGANGERYRILMRPGSSSSSSIRRPPLQVGAQLLTADGTPAGPADVKGEGVLCLACAELLSLAPGGWGVCHSRRQTGPQLDLRVLRLACFCGGGGGMCYSRAATNVVDDQYE